MALEDADKQFISEAIAEAMKAKSADGGNDPKGNQPTGNNFSEEEIRKQVMEQQQSKDKETELKNSITFVLGVDRFIEQNKSFLPSNLGNLITVAQGRNFSNENEKAHQLQKLMLDEVFSKQEAVDILPDTLKAKLMGYKSLAEDQKLKKTFEYFDLVETYSLLKKGQSAKAFNGSANEKDNAFESKFFGTGKNNDK